MDDRLAAKRCELCDLVFVDTAESFEFDVINGDILSEWCSECTREVRESRNGKEGGWEYLGSEYESVLRDLRKSDEPFSAYDNCDSATTPNCMDSVGKRGIQETVVLYETPREAA